MPGLADDGTTVFPVASRDRRRETKKRLVKSVETLDQRVELDQTKKVSRTWRAKHVLSNVEAMQNTTSDGLRPVILSECEGSKMDFSMGRNDNACSSQAIGANPSLGGVLAR